MDPTIAVTSSINAPPNGPISLWQGVTDSANRIAPQRLPPKKACPTGQESELPQLFLLSHGKMGTRHHKNLEGAQTNPPDAFDGHPEVPESGAHSEGSK